MTRAQSTIIWLGLALVIMNLIVHWSDVKKTVFTSPPSGSSQPPSNSGGLFGPILGPIISGATGGLLSAHTPQQTPSSVLA